MTSYMHVHCSIDRRALLYTPLQCPCTCMEAINNQGNTLTATRHFFNVPISHPHHKVTPTLQLRCTHVCVYVPYWPLYFWSYILCTYMWLFVPKEGLNVVHMYVYNCTLLTTILLVIHIMYIRTCGYLYQQKVTFWWVALLIWDCTILG